MAGTNNFLVFNEANDAEKTMSDADYLADLYRINGGDIYEISKIGISPSAISKRRLDGFERRMGIFEGSRNQRQRTSDLQAG